MGFDVFALSDKEAENGKAKGCANGEAKNNPHCGQDQCDSNLTCYFDEDGGHYCVIVIRGIKHDKICKKFSME